MRAVAPRLRAPSQKPRILSGIPSVFCTQLGTAVFIGMFWNFAVTSALKVLTQTYDCCCCPIDPTRAHLSAHLEQIIHVPEPQVVEEIAGVVQIIYQEGISKHITGRIVDVPVLMQRQISFIQTVQKTWKVPQVQFLD